MFYIYRFLGAFTYLRSAHVSFVMSAPAGRILVKFIPFRKYVEKIQTWINNLLKPTGYVMHHQFNIQQLYALPTLYLCVLYLSQNKQRLVPLAA